MTSKKYIISTHIWANGPAQEFRHYLNSIQVDELLFISHPLFYHQRLSSSGYECYQQGILVKKHSKQIKKIPTIVSYFKDWWLNIFYVLKQQGKYDYYVGFNNLNAFSGLLLRKIGKVEKCIYYVVDYTPNRFANPILNKIYHWMETYCARHCDETWNLSWRMVEAREKFKGVKLKECGTQKVVPMGVWLDNVVQLNDSEIDKNQLVFMGHILKKQGVQYVLDAIPYILQKIPEFKFLVIGDGDYLPELKTKAKQLNLDQHVQFTGYIEDHSIIEKMVAESSLAVALYEQGDLENNWTYYADAGKLKVYLGAGVPVLLSDVPPNAKDIEDNKCGKIVSLEPVNIANAVIELMGNQTYRDNALEYIRQYDWNEIFSGALKE